MQSWSHFEHGADVGVEGRGATVAAAFEQVALGLTGIITDPARVRHRDAVSLRCSAPDLELLLVEWLGALLYEMDARRMLFGRFAVHLDGTQLTATAWGEPLDLARHAPAVEVKGPTLTELGVSYQGDQWVARLVVDV
jgi:tRNA nucleotidyltransferase (CCA-adding enzyme)